jgi:hypothetical protein
MTCDKRALLGPAFEHRIALAASPFPDLPLELLDLRSPWWGCELTLPRRPRLDSKWAYKPVSGSIPFNAWAAGTTIQFANKLLWKDWEFTVSNFQGDMQTIVESYQDGNPLDKQEASLLLMTYSHFQSPLGDRLSICPIFADIVARVLIDDLPKRQGRFIPTFKAKGKELSYVEREAIRSCFHERRESGEKYELLIEEFASIYRVSQRTIERIISRQKSSE